MSVEDHGGTPPSSQPSAYPHAAAEPASPAGSWLGTDFQRDLQNFTNAANSGGFFLTPEGSEALLKPINNALEELNSQFTDVLQHRNHVMKLGDSAAARGAADYHHNALYGDEGSALQAIQSSIQALVQAKAAIEKSVKDTTATDQGAGNSFGKIDT
jgi:hypothetical protein